MKRLGILLGAVALVGVLMWALDTAAVPIAHPLPGASDRGPEPSAMALSALGLLAIGAALRRRS